MALSRTMTFMVSKPVFAIVVCLVLFGAGPQRNGGLRHDSRNVGEMLEVMAESFERKAPEDLSLVVQFDIGPGQELWYVVVENGRHVKVGAGRHNGAQFTFVTDVNTLGLIYAGKMSALTAAGKARGSDTAPLELTIAEGVELVGKVRKALFAFLQSFFNTSIPERTLLAEEHSRFIHGGHSIPLYYYPGFRSAWYLLKRGERLNEPGDTDPFPQALIIIEGEGFAKIGREEIRVKAGESYYIPPGSEHMVWSGSGRPLILIWLAWGEGA